MGTADPSADERRTVKSRLSERAGAGIAPTGGWIAFWDSDHSIYVNSRHRDVHYRTIAEDLRRLLPAGAVVLDYGCGEALHADIIAANARRLILCEAAPSVRTALVHRFSNRANIEVCDPDTAAALPSGSIDAVVLHSVTQYLTPQELDRLLALFRRLLAGSGMLIVGDIIPPDSSALTDAIALLRFARANGFLTAALIGLARTFLSDYWRLRSRLGLTRYSEAVAREKLAAAGFSATRAAANVGHNPARMTLLARPA